MSDSTHPTTTPIDPIRLAIPSKGHLYEGIVELLRTAGYKVKRASDRQYEATIAGQPRFHVVFMRPADIVDQVQQGRCHLGVTGMDVYAEHAESGGPSTVVTPDLGYGGCRLVVAVPESWIDVGHILDLVDLTSEFKAAGKTFRVSTKYASLVRAYFRRWGIFYYQLIPSDGALELHPSLGIAEITGGTVLESAACLIGHAASLRSLASEGLTGPLAVLLDAIDSVRSAEGWLHLEVVGRPASAGVDSAVEVAAYLRSEGAQHVFRGEVWDDQGQPGWRVTGLIPARHLVRCQRRLLALGAARAVGLPTRFVFDRDAPSTFDRLTAELASRPAAD
jgi:ATP phosphoribosyltransferase